MPRSAAARAAWLTFVATLPVYLATMNRTVGFIDRGELAAVAWTFGIPHATGYPTLMLLAGGLAHLLPLRPIVTMNLLAAVLTAAGAAIMVLLIERVLASCTLPPPPRVRAILAGATALFCAFTLTWWQQANGFEVYALHAVFMPLVVLLGIRWVDAAAEDAAGGHRAAVLFAFVLGLSLTNHLTTTLLIPGIAVYAIKRIGFGPRLRKHLAAMAAAFGLGLLPYAWLPIRSRMQPRFDWGDPETLPRLVHHMTGADYRNWMFHDPGAMVQQLDYLLWRIPSDFAWVGLALAGIGALFLVRRAPALGAAILALAAAGTLFAIGYRIPDPDAYLMTTLLGLGVCVAVGLLRVHERFGARAALAVAAALLVANTALHWRACDEHDNRMVEGMAVDLLGPLPPNAVLFTTGWDIGEAGALYLQEVEGYRPDVLTVSLQLSRASWYLDELARRAPALVARAQPAFDRYRAALEEAGGGGEAARMMAYDARAAFFDAFVVGAMRDRPVFSMNSLPELRPDIRRVPWHLAVWMRADSSYVAETPWTLAFHSWRGRLDLFTVQSHWAYATARFGRAQYEWHHHHRERARALLAEATTFDPHVRPEQITPQPLGLEAKMLESARFFRDLEAEATRLAAEHSMPPAGDTLAPAGARPRRALGDR